jgi:hypothetical protein
MKEQKPLVKEILSLAQETKYYCELLIQQSRNWAAAEKEEKEKGEEKKSLIIKN